MTATNTTSLQRLARLYRLQSIYYDGLGRRNSAPVESILQTLRVLGAPVNRFADVTDALRYEREARWRRGIEPVLLAWDNGPLEFTVRLPENCGAAVPRYRLRLETGEVLEGDASSEPRQSRLWNIEGGRFISRALSLPDRLPLGYHRLELSFGALSLEAFIIAAPSQAYTQTGATKQCGLFAPVYAMGSPSNWGVGDVTDLESLVGWAQPLGISVIATLPLLPLFLDEPCDPSPYAAVSRRFWNELYLDITRVADLEQCPVAREWIESADFQADLERLRNLTLIDYRAVMTRKREVLELLAHSALSKRSKRHDQFKKFVRSHPLAEDYAAFRAKTESKRTTWRHWSGRAYDGQLVSGEYSGSAKRYHLYVQWLAHEQMRSLGHMTQTRGMGLYLDFPLGVNRDGYDVWRERSVFALAASGGAPPDGFFIKGQNWGFPPLHPEGLRQQGYRYFAESLRHHMQHAKLLRIDHVMGLHRLFWIPQGGDCSDGLYIHYPAEEFYAVVNLESQRHKTQIVGENLGTVPDYINHAMRRHKLFGMHVGQFGVGSDPRQALSDAPANTLASLNTHDTATFAGFWSGSDIKARLDSGGLSEAQAGDEHRYREAQRTALTEFLRSQRLLDGDPPDPAAILKGWLNYLAKGPTELLLVNLEDLWLELEPQNVPGTWQERPNWRRKFRYTREQIAATDSIAETLRAISSLRDGKQ